MEKKVQGAEPPVKVEKWRKYCIFRVPLRFKVIDGRYGEILHWC